LKASNSKDKTTLPGRLQIYRGIDQDGFFVGDVIGSEGEVIEIPGAARVETLLKNFWENGQHAAIPSIEKQKAFVEDQRKRLRDIDNYPRSVSPQLEKLRDDLTLHMRADNSGWQEILKMPEVAADELRQ
jgi:hypothetical protein